MRIGDNFHAFLWRSTRANNCNCYLIDGPQKVLIDPGHHAYFQHVEQGLQGLGLGVADIDVVLVTHAHPDHIEAVREVKAAGAKFGLHQEAWAAVKAQLSRVIDTGASVLEVFQPDFFLQEGELQIEKMHLQVLHTPGHSPGSVCFYSAADGVLITGDLIFKDGFGRTDLPGGDGPQLKHSLARAAEIPARYVLPGHGGIISGAEEVKTNHEHLGRMAMHYI